MQAAEQPGDAAALAAILARAGHRLALVRYHDYSQAAILDPGTGAVETYRRRRIPDPPYWTPGITACGLFDVVGDLRVALYRMPAEPRTLYLQLGPSRFEVDGSVDSSFSPELIGDREPTLANADVLRRFELSVRGALVARHEYRLDDREERLARAADLFPSWPDEEEDYDLLLLVHRLVRSGSWSRVLLNPLSA